MTETVDRSALRRNESLTFRANMGVGRHGWLRLTPAYGVKVVRDRISHMPEGSRILDPFSGTGTTPLAAAELGHVGLSIDVNPFLIWLGNTKLAFYSPQTLLDATDAAQEVETAVRALTPGDDLWQPNLFKIEKWWSPGALHALKALRAVIDRYEGQVRDLLEIALCRSLIACSNAAFNHQSMSFKEAGNEPVLFEMDDVNRALSEFDREISAIIQSARYDLIGSGEVFEGDSRYGVDFIEPVDFLVTSPPYVNRMSYIRELRPYMYWLGYLDQTSDAGELDWKAIGGTWGTATSKTGKWQVEGATPVDEVMEPICVAIAADGGKNGPLLGNYVRKYFHDMWAHFQSVTPKLKPGGEVSYIVGNSTFYGHEVPAQDWYAEMMRTLGYKDVNVQIIRKRNSNKRLFEYDVTGRR